MNWRLAEKMEKIPKEKQETAETIEKEPEEVMRSRRRIAGWARDRERMHPRGSRRSCP